MAIAFRSVKGLVDKVIQATTKAVTSKNQTFNASDDGIDGYSSFTVDITMDGNATTSDVLSGKTYYKDSLTKQTGTMTNRGGWTATGTAGQNTTIPEGYHNGNGYVKCPSASSLDTLWKNSSPDTKLTAQTITFNSSSKLLSNYTYLVVKYRLSTTDSEEYWIAMRVSDFVDTKYNGTPAYGYSSLVIWIPVVPSGTGTTVPGAINGTAIRMIYYDTDNSVTISHCRRPMATTDFNAYGIITEICGAKW